MFVPQCGVSQLPGRRIEPPAPSRRPVSPSLSVLQRWWLGGSFGGHLALPPPGSRSISKQSETPEKETKARGRRSGEK